MTALIRDEPRGGLFPIGRYPEHQALGIGDLNNRPNSASHAELLSDPSPVTIIMNDGCNDVPTYEESLRQRAGAGHRTRIILGDPDSGLIHSGSLKSDEGSEWMARYDDPP